MKHVISGSGPKTREGIPGVPDTGSALLAVALSHRCDLVRNGIDQVLKNEKNYAKQS